jgi:hypothetical protein
MEMLYFIFKVQNKKGSINEVIFVWSRQGVDGGQDITTWWFTHLGSSIHLIYFDFKTLLKTFWVQIFLPSFCCLWWLCDYYTNGFHHLKCDLVLECIFSECVFKNSIWTFHACYLFSHAQMTFFHHSSHFQLKLKNKIKYRVPKFNANIEFNLGGLNINIIIAHNNRVGKFIAPSHNTP